MKPYRILAALCCLAISGLGAGRKISDYTETLEPADAWLYEIAVPGVTNYKVTFGTMATNIIARVPVGGGGGSLVTNANQFGASTTLTLKGGLLITNASLWGPITNNGYRAIWVPNQLIIPTNHGDPISAQLGFTFPITNNYNLFVGTGGVLTTNTVGVLDPVDPLSFESNGSMNGVWNTFVGMRAGLKNVSGNENTFVGTAAGQENVNGVQNTFIGNMAGISNTNGYHNTFVGTSAGQNNTDGFFNTRIGCDNGLLGTGGSRNTSVGASTAGYDSGVGNSWFGAGSGSANTVGFANTASGSDSLVANINGNYNSAYGYQANALSTAASNVTAQGYNALLYSAGSHNTGIGGPSGYNPQNNIAQYRVTSDNHITLLGYGATKNNAVAAITNAMALGAGAHVFTNNQVVLGNTNITTTLLNGNVGIDTNSPQAKLHVVGLETRLQANSSFLSFYNAAGVRRGYVQNVEGSAFVLNQEQVQSMWFQVNNDTRLAIAASGNVGVGTETPGAKLSVSNVVGIAGTPLFHAGTNNTGHGFLIDSNGNVSIGSRVPSSTLDVTGQVRAASAIFTNSLVVNGVTITGSGNFSTNATNLDVYTTLETFGHVMVASNLWVTGALSAPSLSVVNFFVNTLNLTNALGSNQVRMGVQDLTNSVAVSPTDGQLLAWDSGMKKWTNRTPDSFASTTQAVAAAIGTLHVTNKVGIGVIPTNSTLEVLPTLSGAEYVRINDTNGTRRIALGVQPSFTDQGAIWVGNITPSAINYAMSGNGSALNINGDIISFNAAAGPRWQIDGTGHLVGGTDGTRNIGGNTAGRPLNAFLRGSIATYRSNLIASASIGIGVSGTNWTNSAVFTSLTNNVTVYIDASTATTVATISKNGQQIAASIAASMATVMLKPDEYVTISYSGTAPTARWESW